MSSIRLKLPPKLIESARASQYANRERQGVKETNRKVAYRAKIEAVKQKKQKQLNEQREGGQLEHVKAKSYKVWTHPYCVCGGFLLVPSAIPDGTRFGAPPTYSFVSQEWVRKNPDNPNDNSLVLRTVITPNPNGSLIRLSLVEGDFDTCEYAVLGDIRTPEDGNEHPGYWPDQNEPYDELGNKAPGFVFDAASEMLVNSATYQSDRTLLNWLYGQSDEWPVYMDSILGIRNYGFFHHLATKSPPPAKPDQKMYDKHGVLLPMRFKRDPSKQDDNNTPKDESIEAFGGDVYSTCTFEVIISLGTVPLASGTTKKVIGGFGNTGEDMVMSITGTGFTATTTTTSYELEPGTGSFSYPARCNPGNWQIRQAPTKTFVVSETPFFFEYFQLQDTWSHLHQGQMVVVIGDITFSAETLNNPDVEDNPRSQWRIYYWNSDKTIDSFLDVEPSNEYHLAVVYQKYINPRPQQDNPDTAENEEEPATTQGCDVFINGVKRGTITREQEVSGDKLMATAVAAVSQKYSKVENTRETDPNIVTKNISYTITTETETSPDDPYYDNFCGTAPIYVIPGGVTVREVATPVETTQVVGKFPYTITTAEPTTECRVGFHSLRFTPEQALYTESFTPPVKITSLA
jgi:hypothetical protein